MKAEFPDAIDDFRLPMTREAYNAGVTEERPLSPLRFAFILEQLERYVQELSEADARLSAENREAIRRIELALNRVVQSGKHHASVLATGEVDGMNTIFQTPLPYQPGTLTVMLNGLIQLAEVHVTEVDTMTFALTEAPVAGDVVSVSFIGE